MLPNRFETEVREIRRRRQRGRGGERERERSPIIVLALRQRRHFHTYFAVRIFRFWFRRRLGLELNEWPHTAWWGRCMCVFLLHRKFIKAIEWALERFRKMSETMNCVPLVRISREPTLLLLLCLGIVYLLSTHTHTLPKCQKPKNMLVDARIIFFFPFSFCCCLLGHAQTGSIACTLRNN